MTERPPLALGGEVMNGCQACVTLGFDGSSHAVLVAVSARQARYLWNLFPTEEIGAYRLCVGCCARWRAEVEAGKRIAPYRISEMGPRDPRRQGWTPNRTVTRMSPDEQDAP